MKRQGWKSLLELQEAVVAQEEICTEQEDGTVKGLRVRRRTPKRRLAMRKQNWRKNSQKSAVAVNH